MAAIARRFPAQTRGRQGVLVVAVKQVKHPIEVSEAIGPRTVHEEQITGAIQRFGLRS